MKNNASNTVWRWREAEDSAASGDSRKKRATRQSLIAVVIAAVFLVVGHYIMGCVVACIAGVMLLSAYLSAPIYDALNGAIELLARGIVRLTTLLLLVPFFYLCFVPGRLVMAMLRKDSLKLRFEPDRESYWEEGHRQTTPETSVKQF